MAWRVGKKVGRTLYDSEEGGPGALIGVMDKVEDAVLASAAPDLLEALRNLMVPTAEYPEFAEEWAAAEAAIAKATAKWEPTR